MPQHLIRLACLLAVSIAPHCLAEESLCKRGETVYFSCQVERGRLVSLCGNSLKNGDHFWLQYRFGKPEALQLTFPKRKLLFSESGFDIGYFRRANGFDIDISFTNSNWSYTVFHWTPGEGETQYRSGVFVARNRSGPGTTLKCVTDPNLKQFQALTELAQTYGKD